MTERKHSKCPDIDQFQQKKICLIIGGGGGIGKAWVQAARESNYPVLITLRDSQTLTIDPGYSQGISLDIGDSKQIDHLCHQLKGLVINRVVIASGIKQGKTIEFGQDLFEKTLSVNYLGPVYLIKQLIACGLVSQQQSRIIILSSCLHDPANPYRETDWTVHSVADILHHQRHPAYNRHIAYYKSKFALECFVKASAYHMPEYPIISVNPGFFPKTGIFQQENSRYRESKIAEQPDIMPESFIDYYKWFLTSSAVQNFAYYDLQQTDLQHSDLQDDRQGKPESDQLTQWQQPQSIPAVTDFLYKSELWNKTTDIYKAAQTHRESIMQQAANRFELYSINICGTLQHAKATHLEARLNWLMAYLNNHRPEIVCIQEVSRESWEQLTHFAKTQAYTLAPDFYCWDDQSDDHVINATLLKSKPLTQSLVKLPVETTNLDYHCLFTSLGNICIANIHLHAGEKYALTRRHQLDFLQDNILKASKSHDLFILCGDFNFNLDEDSLITLLEEDIGLIDTWKILRPEEPGYTQNPEENTLRRQVSQNHNKRRVDGIFIAPSDQVQLDAIDIFADEPIFCLDNQQDNQTFFLSDHYGLRFSCSTRQASIFQPI